MAGTLFPGRPLPNVTANLSAYTLLRSRERSKVRSCCAPAGPSPAPAITPILASSNPNPDTRALLPSRRLIPCCHETRHSLAPGTSGRITEVTRPKPSMAYQTRQRSLDLHCDPACHCTGTPVACCTKHLPNIIAPSSSPTDFQSTHRRVRTPTPYFLYVHKRDYWRVNGTSTHFYTAHPNSPIPSSAQPRTLPLHLEMRIDIAARIFIMDT